MRGVVMMIPILWNIPFQFSVNEYREPFIVFPIPLPNQTVFMSHNLSKKQDCYMVIADTAKFINIWRLSTNDDRFPNYHVGDRKLWRADYKFGDAERGFSLGIENPVPIATNISYDFYNHRREIIFNNDFTRTIWLLANDAKYFPVVIANLDAAKAFQKDMGFGNNPIQLVSNIKSYARKEHSLDIPS